MFESILGSILGDETTNVAGKRGTVQHVSVLERGASERIGLARRRGDERRSLKINRINGKKF